MRVGLLPALGGGIRALAQSGQQSRLHRRLLPPVRCSAFDGRRLLQLPARNRSPSSPTTPTLRERGAGARAAGPDRPRPPARLQIPFAHAAELRDCAALRVFQITGVIPALHRAAALRHSLRDDLRLLVRAALPARAEAGAEGPRGATGACKHAAAVIATTPELAARASRAGAAGGADPERRGHHAVPPGREPAGRQADAHPVRGAAVGGEEPEHRGHRDRVRRHRRVGADPVTLHRWWARAR